MADVLIKLPFRRESTVPRPPEVGTTPSGTLPDLVLIPCGIRTFRMTSDAARAVRAMKAAAADAGVLLDATGTYRTLDGQLTLFLSRYEPCTKEQFDVAKAKKQARFWEGALAQGHPSTFWRKIVVNGKVPADAAAPGSSTHGVGVSVDLARTNPDRPSGQPLSLDSQTLRWLADNAERFGMWNTSTSENWHFSHFGPGVTEAVLAFEAAAGLRAPAPLETAFRRPQPPAPQVDLSDLAAAVARVKTRILFLDNPDGNDAEAVRWLRIRLNVTLHLTGTAFQLDETSSVFDRDLDAFVVAFQEHIRRFVEGLSEGKDTFAVDHRVGPDTWFWLFS